MDQGTGTGVATDRIIPYNGPDIEIGPVHYPQYAGDAASKKYVDDTATALIPNYISPLAYNPILNEVTIASATAGPPVSRAGVVTTVAQSFAGHKTFAGNVIVQGTTTVITPVANTDASTKKYVDDKALAASVSAATLPLYLTVNPDTSKTVNIYPADGAPTAAAGILTTGAQNIAGVKTFQDGLVSGVTPAAGDASTAVANTSFVDTATIGLNFDANNGWVSGTFVDRKPTLHNGLAPKVYPLGYNMTDKGTYDCSGGGSGVYPAYNPGDYYTVSVGGTLTDPVTGVPTTYTAGDWMIFGGVFMNVPPSLQAILPLLSFKGYYDASSGVYPVGASVYDMYIISVTGVISATTYTAGDMMIFLGVVPWMDIPAAYTSGLLAAAPQGVWDASTLLYPPGAQNGYFWVATGAGKINGTPFAVGDWILYSDIRWYDLPEAAIPLILAIPRIITTTFTIQPGKVRFTIASDDATAANPQATRVLDVFAGSLTGDIAILAPGLLVQNAIGVYVDQSGVLHLDKAGTDPSLMYDWVQIATLLVQSFTLTSAIAIPPYLPGQYYSILNIANVKCPVPTNHQLTMMEIVNYLTPLNLGPNAVSASASPSTDLSIQISTGQFWENMAAVMPAPGVTNRKNPNVVTAPGQVMPLMYGTWIEFPGPSGWHFIPPSTQLNVTTYNPQVGASPWVLTTIPDLSPGPQSWINIPIMYNSAVGVYVWQYPSELYSTSSDALAHVGKFIRVSGVQEFKLLNIVGFVTVQAYAPDLTSTYATFGGGEFFNYGVGGASGSAGGGGGASGVFQQQNVAWVDPLYGSIATGTWNNSTKPFPTYDSATALIASTDALNEYAVKVAPGGNNDWASFKAVPYINLDGMSPMACCISVGAPANAVTLATSGGWNTAATSPTAICFAHATFTRGTSLNFDFYTTAPSTACASSVRLEDIIMNQLIPNLTPPPTNVNGATVGTLTFKSRKGPAGTASTDTLTAMQLSLDANINLDGGTAIFENLQQQSSYTTHVYSTNVNTTVTFHACVISNLNIHAPGSGVLTVLINSCLITGTLTIGANATPVKIDRASLNIAGSVVGSSYTVYDDELSLTIQASLADAVHNVLPSQPLSGTNPVIDKAKYDYDMALKAGTVNSQAVSSGSVIVRAQDIPANGVSGSTFLSATIIPNNSANTSGTAANLTAASSPLLPTGVQATTITISGVTPPDTRIANVGSVKTYVTGLAGANSGLATLDALGKLTTAQIPASLVGGMAYQGSFAPSGGSYPSPPTLTAGNYWIASDSGTVLGVAYVSGDWAVYNGGAVWNKIDNNNVASYLSTWGGSSMIATVGTITSGKWESASLGGKIASSYGGVGDLVGPGIVKVSALGVSSVASHPTDYIKTSDAIDLVAGGGTLAVPTQTSTNNTTYAASTAFVNSFNSRAATTNVLYVNQVNGLAGNNGSTIEQAFNTIANAIAACTAPTSSNLWIIKCNDTTCTTGFTLTSWIGLEAPNTTFTTGAISLAPDSYARIKQATGCTITYSVTLGTGAVVTDPTVLLATRLSTVSIVVTASGTAPALRYLSANQIDLNAGVSGLTVNDKCSMFLSCDRLTGGVNITGANAVLDATRVGDFASATWALTSSPTVKYPLDQLGNLTGTGLVKYGGTGTFSIGSPGTDFVGTGTTFVSSPGQDVTVGGNVGAITTSIPANQIALGKLAKQTGPIVLGVSGNSAADIATISYGSDPTASYIVSRDGYANTSANHVTTTYGILAGSSELVSALGHTAQQLVIGDGTVVEVTGSSSLPFTLTLPSCTLGGSLVPIGYEYKFVNSNNAVLNIAKYGGAALGTLPQYGYAIVVCTNASSAAGAWDFLTTVTSLTGDVVGTAGVGATSIATSISGLPLSKLANVAANTYLGSVAGGAVTALTAGPSMFGTIANNTVLGNISGGVAAPTAISATSAATGSNVMIRDTDANAALNALVESVQSRTAGVTLTKANASVQVFTAITTEVTVALPDATTLSNGHRFTLVNDSAPSAGNPGTLLVNDGGAGYLCRVGPNFRCKFVLVSNATAAGTWTWSYKSKIPPQLFLSSSFTSGTYYRTGTPINLTAAEMFAGSIVVSHTNIMTINPPAATTLIGTDNTSGLWGILGSCPHNGFNFPLSITRASATYTVSLGAAPTGCTYMPASTSVLVLTTQYYTYQMTVWITSPTTYMLLNSRDY